MTVPWVLWVIIGNPDEPISRLVSPLFAKLSDLLTGLPMKPYSFLLKIFISLFFLTMLSPMSSVLANDHGGGASGPEPFKFIVNLGAPSSGGKYLQVEMVFEGATPEVAHHVSANKPKIQHALILLLSGEEAGKLLTLQGKKDLMAEIVETVNHVLHENEKTGVKEVLFTSFIIQ